ncbi:MAG: hypothetical protein QM401_00775 [Bacillota bacterium]|nr:hypothetical protein [Bacillota bacterium]
MRRWYPPFNGKRFIGNTNTTEVHDLDNEQTNCQINEIKTHHIQTFSPDTHAEAERQGFDNCHWCLGDSKR